MDCAVYLALLLLILKHPSQHNSTLEAMLVAWNYFNFEYIPIKKIDYVSNWCVRYGQTFLASLKSHNLEQKL